jgi:anti-anti-sigma factor
VAGGIVVVAKGRIGSITAPVFADAVNAALAAAARVVIDLTEVDYISGAGVQVLQQAAATGGGRTILCGLHDAVRITIGFGGALDGFVEVQTREEAIESLA